MNIDYIAEDFREPQIFIRRGAAHIWHNVDEVARSMNRSVPELIAGLMKYQREPGVASRYEPWILRYHNGVSHIELTDIQYGMLPRCLKLYYHCGVKCAICGNLTKRVRNTKGSLLTESECQRCGFW